MGVKIKMTANTTCRMPFTFARFIVGCNYDSGLCFCTVHVLYHPETAILCRLVILKRPSVSTSECSVCLCMKYLCINVTGFGHQGCRPSWLTSVNGSLLHVAALLCSSDQSEYNFKLSCSMV